MDAHLTAAEASVLLRPDRGDRARLLKLFLLELVARRCISVRRQGWRRKSFVTFTSEGALRLPPARFARTAWRGIGGERFGASEVPIEAVVDSARASFGMDFNGFREMVVQSLVAAQLVELRERKMLGIFHTETPAVTPAGMETAKHINRQLDQFETAWRRTRDNDPEELVLAVRQLGPLVLLVPKFNRKQRELSRLLKLRPPGAAGDSPLWFPHAPAGSGVGPDFAAFEGIDFDGLGDALGAFDGAVGGDGGSDGGGDGGGD